MFTFTDYSDQEWCVTRVTHLDFADGSRLDEFSESSYGRVESIVKGLHDLDVVL